MDLAAIKEGNGDGDGEKGKEDLCIKRLAAGATDR